MARNAETRLKDDVLSACATAHLVIGAVHEFLYLDTAPDVQYADALRSVELVSCDGQKVHAKVVYIDRNLADRLSAVGVHNRAVPMGDVGNLPNRLDCADLVVGVHDRNHDGPISDCVLHLLRINESVAVYWKVRDL